MRVVRLYKETLEKIKEMNNPNFDTPSIERHEQYRLTKLGRNFHFENGKTYFQKNGLKLRFFCEDELELKLKCVEVQLNK